MIEDSVLSGGGDGSVARTRLGGEASEHCTLGATRGKPRIVKCLRDRVLIMDDEGNLYSYGLIDWQVIVFLTSVEMVVSRCAASLAS